MMEDMDDFERIVAHNYTMTEVERIQWEVDGHHLSRMLEHSPPGEVESFLATIQDCFSIEEVRWWTRCFSRLEETAPTP